jgi:hypothetical protein
MQLTITQIFEDAVHQFRHQRTLPDYSESEVDVNALELCKTRCQKIDEDAVELQEDI